MNICILGTGMVAQSIAGKLADLGHSVTLGTRNKVETASRTEPNPMTGISFTDWHKNYPQVKLENYPSAAAGAELIVNATSGSGSIEALHQVGKENIAGKTLLDIANPLDFSNGMPPSLFVSNTSSLAEKIQSEFPEVKVVKSLNTMNAFLMVNPALIPADHNVFVCGNDADAKSSVKSVLQSFGWKQTNIIDLGGISAARGTEQLLPIWVQLMGTLGTAEFNFNIVRK